MFSKKYSEKYVKTLQEKNESLFEDLENAYNEIDQLKQHIEGLELEVTSAVSHHEAEKKRLAETLEFYEKGLLRRDLAIAELEKTADKAKKAYGSLLSLNESISKKLHEVGNKILELVDSNDNLIEELPNDLPKLDGHEPSKSPYQIVTINVDVRDVLYKQLTKTLKQANETFKAAKEEIQVGYLTKGQLIALTVGIATVFGAILLCCFGFFVLLFGAATVFQFLGVVWVLFAAKHFINATFKLYDKAKEEFM